MMEVGSPKGRGAAENSAPARWQSEVEVTVPFYDVDSMQVAWHGNYIKYFEDARCRLLEELGCNYDHMAASGYMWPVVDMRLKYVKPAHFKQRLRVLATIAEWQVRLKIDYRIVDVATGELLTKGYTIQVAVDMATREMCFATPEVFRQKLGVQQCDQV
jgi:acyl-CoA thioester hydrolase